MTSPIKQWREQKNAPDALGKSGEIISWTIIRAPAAGFENQAPYAIALVKLETGKKIMVQIVDFAEDDLKIGRKVITVIRRAIQVKNDEIIPYGIKAKPAQT